MAPLFVYPTHYTGENGYISDTESSEIVPEAVRKSSDGKETSKADKKGAKEIDFDKMKETATVELSAEADDAAAGSAAQTASQIEEISNIGKEFHSEL